MHLENYNFNFLGYNKVIRYEITQSVVLNKKDRNKNSSDIATLQNHNGTIMKTFISHRSDHYRVINVLSLAINH